jgi:hypothetical protein
VLARTNRRENLLPPAAGRSYGRSMRVESGVTSVSWIPSEAVSGVMRLGFSGGISHYDDPPPAQLADAAEVSDLRDTDRFRFANALRAWAEFDDDQPVRWGCGGGLLLGSTTIRVGRFDRTFAAVPMPELRPDPEVGPGRVTFTQTVGGRTALPIPRRVRRAPFVRLSSPLVWTTLRLSLHSDGSSAFELTGASPFPRHWVYDGTGRLAQKAGVADWSSWLGQPAWTATPWGDEDSPVVVTAAESELERELSTLLMRGATAPAIRSYRPGEVIAAQGSAGTELYLVLDGIVGVDVDGRSLGDLGPGAVLGERAVVEQCARTATVRANTAVRVAMAPADVIDRAALEQLAAGHRREHPSVAHEAS